MIEKKCVKLTVISARPNWLRSIDKRGNAIQVFVGDISVMGSYKDWIIQSSLS